MEKEKIKGRKSAFMLVVYFIRKPNGDLFDMSEIAAKENRKQFDSYDTHPVKGGHMLRNEQIGLTKLMNFIAKMKGNYYGGYVIAPKADLKLFTFGRDGIIKHLSFPEFFKDKKTGEVICTAIEKTQTVQVPAIPKVMPLYSNINSPQIEKFKQRAETFTAHTRKMSDNFKHLRT